jgi:hypothetical protein
MSFQKINQLAGAAIVHGFVDEIVELNEVLAFDLRFNLRHPKIQAIYMLETPINGCHFEVVKRDGSRHHVGGDIAGRILGEEKAYMSNLEQIATQAKEQSGLIKQFCRKCDLRSIPRSIRSSSSRIARRLWRRTTSIELAASCHVLQMLIRYLLMSLPRSPCQPRTLSLRLFLVEFGPNCEQTAKSSMQWPRGISQVGSSFCVTRAAKFWERRKFGPKQTRPEPCVLKPGVVKSSSVEKERR